MDVPDSWTIAFILFERNGSCAAISCDFNVLKDIPWRDRCILQSAFYHDWAPEVKPDETHGSHGSYSVRHVYPCEKPPSPNKGVWTVSRDDRQEKVKANQTTVCLYQWVEADGNNGPTCNKLKGAKPCWWQSDVGQVALHGTLRYKHSNIFTETQKHKNIVSKQIQIDKHYLNQQCWYKVYY